MARRWVAIIIWIIIGFIAAFLRLDDLSKRPMHADEATGARIVSWRLEKNSYSFDPSHFHGPLLSALASPLAKLSGENSWQELTPQTLRLIPALAGLMMVLLIYLFRTTLGEYPSMAASALLATSPLFVYFNRMFIHESLLAMLALALLICLAKSPSQLTAAVGGILFGLMFATKETFLISTFVWSLSVILIQNNKRQRWTIVKDGKWMRRYSSEIFLFLISALFAAAWFYSDGFKQLGGLVDAIKTFFVYKTVHGHDKPFFYYAHLLLTPKLSGGIWWSELAIFIFALAGAIPAFCFKTYREMPTSQIIRFLTYSALGHGAAYSIIAYKTPWLMLVPWLHVILLAGCAFLWVAYLKTNIKVTAAILLVMASLHLAWQSFNATHRLSADTRNPYAYVPTTPDVERAATLIHTIHKLSTDPQWSVAVIGREYWPLPWYLRGHNPGYWAEPFDDIEKWPVVLAMPASAETVSRQLSTTHEMVLYGLRDEVAIHCFVRKDLWNLWMKEPSQ